MSEELIGSQVARVALEPDGEDHPRWEDGSIHQFMAELGIALDEWQLEVLRVSLKRNDDRWAAFEVGVCAPRQNGKNGILEVRELAGPLILGEKLLIHTAHLADTSKEAFRRLDDLIDASEWLSRQVKHVWRANGHESIEFQSGQRIRFRTRTRGGGRGFSASPVFFDESMFLPEVSMGSILPVISAQPDPQVWYTGSAVDQEIHDDGIVFARLRERAQRGDKRLAYFEWSLDAPSPDEVPDDVSRDPEVWAETNPALGVRISASYLEVEREALATRTFAVERLGVGDWPRTDGLGNMVIPLDIWMGLTDAESKIAGKPCLVFDTTPDRRSSSIVAVGKRSDGLLHAEIVTQKAGTGWVVAELRRLHAKHKPRAIVCDEIAPASSLIPELEQVGLEIAKVNGPAHAQACGLFYDVVDQQTFRHLGDERLTSAIKGAVKRPLGERWAWSRSNSSVNISPLVAVTLGVGYVLTNEEPMAMIAFV